LYPGPTPTPIGPLCLGLSGNLQLFAFLFDASGAGAVTGVLPAAAAFAGIEVFATAISFDPAQPGGIGRGNGASFVLREPHFWFVHPGSSTPFGTIPGAIAQTNAISDSVGFAQTLTTSVIDAASVPERGWLTMLLGNGQLVAYDGVAATPVFSTPLLGTAAGAQRILNVPGADLLLLLAPGTPPSPFGGGTPGSIHYAVLPGGTIPLSVPLASGNPDAMLAVPGSSLVFLRQSNGVVPFDHGSVTLLPLIPLPSGFGGLVDWKIANGQLYVLHGGSAGGPFGGASPAAISVVDIATLSYGFTQQLAMAAPVQLLRAGPGSLGPALWVYGTTAGALAEFAQGTLTPAATILVGSGITAMELSALGTQWLLICAGGGCGSPTLLQLLPGTTTVTPLAALSAPQSALAISPSASYGKACLALGTNVAAPFGTDPFTALGSIVLPSASSFWRIVPD
ncbi:MAG: hypothetical protein WBO45_14410, partial [Planctomycetota bacterium]